MTITFKDVGQGDSIVITWNFKSIKYAGIIDCKGYGKSVPTINHLKQEKVQKIYFIIISHPHIDHYGGMLKLLEYCEDKSIPINYFMISASQSKRYLSLYETNTADIKLLEKIYNKAIELDEKNSIKRIGHATSHVLLEFHNLFRLQFLSPSDNEVRAYSKKVKLFQQTDELKCSQSANLFSTFIHLKYNNKSFIFTSDCEIETLERIYNIKDLEEVDNTIGIQVPHHGSKKNHFPKLWEEINYSKSYSKAIISVGDNKKYNHPNIETIQSFEDMDYIILSTNYVNGLLDFKENQDELLSILKILDIESELVEEDNGDVVLSIT